MILTFESVDEILKCHRSRKATEQYFPVMLFIMLYKVVLTFESADEILKCDCSNEKIFKYFPLMLQLCKTILTNEAMYKTPKCDHQNKLKLLINDFC